MIGILLIARQGWTEIERKPWDTSAGVTFEIKTPGAYRIALDDANGVRLAISNMDLLSPTDTFTMAPEGIA